MSKTSVLGAAALSVLTATSAQADPIPDPVAAMIRAAADTGNSATLKTVSDLAKKTNPASAKDIDALTATLTQQAADRDLAKIRTRKPWQGWKGQAQAGVNATTGTTDTAGLSLGLNLVRNGVKWRHTVIASANYARQNGITTANQHALSYQLDYKVNDRFFVMGLGSWEGDRFSGFERRFSETLGMGYTALKTPAMTLNLTAGPALRQTRYVAGYQTTGQEDGKFAGRAGLDYSWTIRPGVVFTENASFYGQTGNSTLTANTALTMKVFGRLSVQAGLLLDYETLPPVGTEKTNTTSHLTLVYGF
jgi:putative salt-induced outer membrane protein